MSSNSGPAPRTSKYSRAPGAVSVPLSSVSISLQIAPAQGLGKIEGAARDYARDGPRG
ncbi:hypothetical protein GCM10020000_12600 [Streptomyces olivoverticillatus]